MPCSLGCWVVLGRDVLAGRKDWQQINRKSRWLGGVGHSYGSYLIALSARLMWSSAGGLLDHIGGAYEK